MTNHPHPSPRFRVLKGTRPTVLVRGMERLTRRLGAKRLASRVAILILLAIGAARLAAPLMGDATAREDIGLTGAPPLPSLGSDSTMEVLAAQIAEGDPFFLADTSARERASGEGAPASTTVGGTLMVIGVLGGPPWQAVLEGIPGQAGAVVVREGQSLGELRIVRIRRDSLLIAARDTVLRLQLRRP
jgi:hypothetical protein